MIVDPDFLDHWKTRMLSDLLEDERAPLYILRIWAHCQNRRTNTFENLPDTALKALCRFPGHANKLASSLAASGFVRREGADLDVVGWDEYNASLIANWTNGKKGGRPKKTPNGKPMENPWDTHGKPMENPKADRANPSVTDKIGEDKIGEDKIGEDKVERPKGLLSGSGEARPKADPIPYSKVFDLFGELCPSLGQPMIRSESRKAAIKRLWGMAVRLKGSKDAQAALRTISLLFEAAEDSAFLRGEKGKPGTKHEKWRADFDWVVRTNNATGIIEGKYQQ